MTHNFSHLSFICIFCNSLSQSVELTHQIFVLAACQTSRQIYYSVFLQPRACKSFPLQNITERWITIYHTAVMCKNSVTVFIFKDYRGLESTTLSTVDLLALHYIIQGPVAIVKCQIPPLAHFLSLLSSSFSHCPVT